jgi:cytoskeletal protein RodZ
MGDIQVLKEIGLQEVSRRTHIEVKTLQYMLDKEFDKLGRINTLGFLKIISREYHLDLSAWQEEFEAYWDEKSGQAPSKTEAVFAVNAPANTKKNKVKSRLLLLLIIVLLAFGARYFGIWDSIQPVIAEKIAAWNESEENNSNNLQEESNSFVTPSVVNEAQKILEQEPVESIVTQEMSSMLEDNITQEGLQEEGNQTQITTITPSQDINSTEENKSEADASEDNQDVLLSVDGNETSIGAILPNVNIWVGIVYLDNKKRASYLTSDTIELDLTREQIITTGHGNFTLELNGEKEPFKEELPKRFHWDGKELKNINYDKFVELNGGSAW